MLGFWKPRLKQRGRWMRILLVEDEAFIARMLHDALERAGHELLGPVERVADRLALAEQTRPDLALVNINLKDGGLGTDLARDLLNRWGVPSLFVSGQLLDARRNQDVALGYIKKPYAPETVVQSVEVAQGLMNGQEPKQVPAGLKLSGRTEPL